MISKVCDNVWKIPADGNVYFLEKEKTIIDTGSRANRNMIKTYLSKITDLNKIEKVIFTHLHYDHIGNFDLFPNAKFFASKTEIESFKKQPFETVLDEDILHRFNVELNELKDFNGLKIIETPGHTSGSICIWYEKEKVLFSGDTLLKSGHGRIDLPNSKPNEMQNSIQKLLNYNYKHLCTGHEY